MKAPPAHAKSITAEQLLEIIEGLGLPPPQDNELAAQAVEFTKMQRCNDPPSRWWENPGDFTLRVNDGPARPQTPVHLQAAYVRGQAIPPWKRRKKDWRDLAPDIAAGFRRLYPGETFGDRDGPLARFVAGVIPLIFPDQRKSGRAVGLYLRRWSRKCARR
jgi:hypothetical protein